MTQQPPINSAIPSTAWARLAASAMVGGLIGVTMQALMTVLAIILPLELKPFSVSLSLLVLGIAGALLSAAGAYERLNAAGGFGAAIMFSGLADAVRVACTSAKANTGSTGAGAFAGTKAFLLALGATVSALGFVVGIGLHALQVPGALATLTAPAYLPVPSSFVGAFVGAAVISVAGQALMEFVSLSVLQTILVTAATGFALVATGLSVPLDALCAGGIAATTMGAAWAAVGAGVSFAAGTLPMPYAATVCVMLVTTAFSIACGIVAARRPLS